MHQCEVHQEMTAKLHQSDECACNNQQMPSNAQKTVLSIKPVQQTQNIYYLLNESCYIWNIITMLPAKK